MSQTHRRVFFVRGTWGRKPGEQSDQQLAAYVERVHCAEGLRDRLNMEQKKVTITVVDDLDAPELKDALRGDTRDVTVAFWSRGWTGAAKRLKISDHRLRVIVMTAEIPVDEVIFVDKGWLAFYSEQLIKDVLF